MFVNERDGHDRHRSVINRAESGGKAERDQRGEDDYVQPLGEAQAPRDPKFDNQRTNSFAPIKIVILRRVNQIEPGHPANNSSAENKRCKIDMFSSTIVASVG